jgi:hypothetical protein
MTNPLEIPDLCIRIVEIQREEEVLSCQFGNVSWLVETGIHLQALRLCWRIPVRRMRWRYYEFPKDGLYMAPDVEDIPVQNVRTGFEETLSSQAFGIAASLVAFSGFAGVGGGCMERHASLLCVLAANHAETDLIRQAIAGFID